jgi:protein SCO1/2
METSMTLRTMVVALTLVALAAPSASSHSLKELETALGDREKYFQPVDKPAPGFALQDAEGRAIELTDFSGRVVVLHFIYASCPDVCPLHADLIADIQGMLNQSPMKDQARFVSITTDPNNDTPAVMREYGRAHGLDPANWVFLTTRADQPEDATRKLAEAFGHKFTKTEGSYQVHGIVTHVIDQEGRWRANFHGLRFEPSNLIVFVNALTNDVHRPHGHRERGLWDLLKGLFGL